MAKKRKQPSYIETIKAGLVEAGITAVFSDLPADPPAPKSGMTGAELAEYFSNPPKTREECTA